MQVKKKIGVFGASGYSGTALLALLRQHPQVEVHFIASDRLQGQRAQGATQLQYLSVEQGVEAARECAAVFLATPIEGSFALVPQLLGVTQVIDLSGGFRLQDPLLYPQYYGVEHPAPHLLPRAVYGLPELFRDSIYQAQLVANPGCYATATALALAPLLQAGVIEQEVIVNAASGVTGAGRQNNEAFSFSEIDENYRAYKILRHQHTPEIVQTLQQATQVTPQMTFVPHLLPVRTGILVTAYGTLKKPLSLAAVSDVFRQRYQGEPFIGLDASAETVNLRRVVGTNCCEIAVVVGGDDLPNRVVVMCAIDNLLKGAAGQAVQNLNLMLGFAETTGLGRGAFT